MNRKTLGRPWAIGVLVFATALTTVACAESTSSASPSRSAVVEIPTGPNAYLSARALDSIVFRAGTQTNIQPTGKVVEFQLQATRSPWEIAPGKTVQAITYNGTVPGPTIRATEGDTLRVNLRNGLDQETTIHWHGLHIKNAMDGVPPYSQAPVKAGATYTYEFVVSHAGTFMYHPHTNSVAQIDNGLYGLLIVDPPVPDEPKPAREFSMMLGAWNLPAAGGSMNQPGTGGMMPGMGSMDHNMQQGGMGGMSMAYNWFTINGKAFPANAEWTVKEGELVRIRLVNISNLAHPMHLHGQDFKVVSKDGEPLPAAQQAVMNTLTVNPGETYDILMLANNPGTWMFHCHELHHTENDGMEPGGLMQVIRYEGSAATAPSVPPAAATPRPRQPSMPGMGH